MGFALATIISTEKNLLNGAIENSFLAGLLDSLLAGTLTGVGAIVPYALLIGLLSAIMCVADEDKPMSVSTRLLSTRQTSDIDEPYDHTFNV